MKYMLMMAGTKRDFESYLRLSKEELRAQVAFMRKFAKELGDSGVLVLTEGLAFADKARMVRAGSNGEPITDGVFPESKEFLARILDCRRRESRRGIQDRRPGVGRTRTKRPSNDAH